jgi:diguanylate cyclase (GGDEF)-like protein
MVLILVRAIETIHLMRKNSQLSDYAYIDGATGLYNKRRCIDQLGRTNVLKPQCETCCLMFDLNDLKVTNDRFGHEAGDDLIRRFACALRESAPDDMFLGRFGGDEFIGIVDNVHEREIQEFLSRLEAAAKRSEYDNEQPLSYAYGVAFAQHTEGETLQSLLDQADAKMYERKAQMKSAASRDTHGSPAYDSDSSSARISC